MFPPVYSIPIVSVSCSGQAGSLRPGLTDSWSPGGSSGLHHPGLLSGSGLPPIVWVHYSSPVKLFTVVTDQYRVCVAIMGIGGGDQATLATGGARSHP